MSRRWTREYLQNGFVDDIKKARAEQGYDTNKKPTHKWLRKNGFGYFLQRVRELGYKPDEWLLEECDFEPRKKSFPCSNPETVRHIEQWFGYIDEVGNRVNGTSVEAARTHIRRSMEIAKKTIGTTDIAEIGRGEKEVCFNRAEQIMRGFDEELDTGQSKYNYASTLRDLLAWMKEKNAIDYNPMTFLVEDCGWAGDSEPVKIAPSTSLVKEYFDACKTRTEQMVLICLVILGLRPDDFCDPKAIERISFDDAYTYVEFSSERKNGPGIIPIVLCQDFIEEWIQFVEKVPGNDNALFPSKDSADGARTTQWVRDTIEDIGNRVEGTLRNGEKPKPKHFRNFWYTEYTKVYSEFRKHTNFAASLQGSKSGRVPAESYTDELKSSWFDTFVNFARPKLKVPVADLEPAERIGNIDIGQNMNIDEICGKTSLVETAKQTTFDRWQEAKALFPSGAVAYFTSYVGVAVASTAAKWVKLKHIALSMDPDAIHYPHMSIRRQAGLGVVIGIIITVQLSLWRLNGEFEKLIAGDPIAWLPLVISVIFAVWLFDREFPDPRDVIEIK